MNAEDLAHWLEPSPPIAVDGEEPRTRPRLLPAPPPADDVAAPAADPPPGDHEDGRAASHSS